MCSDYQNFQQMPDPSTNVSIQLEDKKTTYTKYVNFSRNGVPSDKLTVMDLNRFGFEICNAMEYLWTKKVMNKMSMIHRPHIIIQHTHVHISRNYYRLCTVI